MLRSEKKEFILSLEDVFNSAEVIVLAHYHGLTVAQITDLRVRLREQNANFKVIKNTLAKIAASNIEVYGLNDVLAGPVALAYSDEVTTVPKLMVMFSKENPNLKVIGGIFRKQAIDVKTVNELASLPSISESRANLVSILQTPMLNLTSTLHVPVYQLVNVLSIYSNQTK